ncbi:MAG: glycine cleavage system aminomethyltransferase GcvT [Lachnospiraceae bacterium]|nr:glycine cleavage system aminomethyltransferase GcvT [Lachnospiraceae bacterium]
MEQKTPLYDVHVSCGGKIVPFAGYLLPVQYQTGVIKEHNTVRTGCGMFDVSHMGEITCIGPDALNNLNHILTNDFSEMYDGQARYSPMCYENGGVVDDLIVYKVRDDHYFIVVNASNKDKDFAWMKQHEDGQAVFTDISETVGQIALQGPKADEILAKLAKPEDFPVKYYSANFHAEAAGIPCVISKTGYTGEDGYELYMAADQAPAMWAALMEAGAEYGLIPCGLGARDTLRLEAAMPLYGHEMDEHITPLETGLKFAVKLKKAEFIGKEALEAEVPGRKRIGLKVTGRGIIREHEDLYLGDRVIGMTTSGTHAPYLGYPIAMALVEADAVQLGDRVEADVRGRRVEAEVVALPFYKKEDIK